LLRGALSSLARSKFEKLEIGKSELELVEIATEHVRLVTPLPVPVPVKET
jgi:hypothetical protein